MGPPLQHVCGIAIGACEARAVVIRRDSAAQGGIAQPSLVSSESGARGTPCAVALGGKGECVVGDAALSQAAKNPKARIQRALPSSILYAAACTIATVAVLSFGTNPCGGKEQWANSTSSERAISTDEGQSSRDDPSNSERLTVASSWNPDNSCRR